MPIERNPKNLWKGAIQCIVKTIRHRKDRSVNHFMPSKEILKYYEENFKMLHRKLKKTSKLENEKLYNKIILLNNIENLYVWASHVQSVLEKEAKVPEKKTSVSKFKFWEKKPAANSVPEVPPEETYEILFSEIEAAPLPAYSLLPKSYVRMRFELNLGSGVFKLIKPSLTHEDSLIFTYTSLYTSVNIKVQGLDSKLTMQDLSLSSFTERRLQQVIKKVSSTESLWNLEFRLKPDEILSWSLESVFQSLEINYHPNVMKLILSFFIIPSTQESAKNAAWDTIKGIQDTTQEALNDLLHGETQYKINVKLFAPVIKIPSPTSQGFFWLNLGDISVNNKPSSDTYEYFLVSMSSLGLSYEPTNFHKVEVIYQFEISSLLKILKSKYKQKKKAEDPDMIIESKLPIFKVILNSSIFYQLQKLPEMFNFEEKSNVAEKSESKFQGKVKKMTSGIYAWKEYIGALKGSYLYFYGTDGFGSMSSLSFYIKDCSIQDVSSEMGIENTLKLQNIYGECVFSVESRPDFQQWMLILSEAVNEFESRTSLAVANEVHNSQNINLKLSFEAPTAVILLTNEKSESVSNFTFSKLKSEIVSKDYEYVFNATLGGMEIEECKNSEFSKLFQSKDSQDLISMSFKHIDSKSSNYQNQDFELGISCGLVKVNWNYHLIMYLLNFFQFAEYSDPTLIIAEQVGTIAKDHTLLNIAIQINKIDIYLNNPKNEISLACVSIQEFKSNYSIQSEGSLWDGTLGNLEISDLTNYPATALNVVAEPFQLFSVRNNNSIMKFKIILYADSFEGKDKDTGVKVEAELNSINFVYLHQPVLRIIDYLNYHVLGAFDTQTRVKEIDENSVCKPKRVEEKLSFTSIIVKINEPVVSVPTRPGCKEHFEINLGIITVKNRLNKANNPGWEDIYAISMQKLMIFTRKEGVLQNIADEFDMDLEIQRKLLTSEHLKDVTIDKAYKISGNCEGIKLTLSLRDYNLLVKTSDLNILYDDQLESYISPTYKYIEPVPGEFLKIDFKIKIISILFMVDFSKLFELFCIDQTITTIKYNNGTVFFNMKSSNILGLIDENSVTSKDPEFRSLSEQVFSISYDSLSDFFDYTDYYRLSYILCGPISNVHPEILNISLTSSLDSSKEIVVNLAHLRINFHLSMFYQLLNFFSSGIPNYTAAKDTPQDYLTRYRPDQNLLMKELEKKYFAPKISATCYLTKSFVVLPSITKTTTLVAHSDLTFNYIKEKEGLNLGPDVIKRLILEKFQIFHAKYEDLLNSFLVDSKRKVLEPMQFIFEVKEFRTNNCILQQYVIGSLNCALSYRDLLILKNSHSFQQEMLVKDNGSIRYLENFSNLQAVENRLYHESGDFSMEALISKLNTSYNFAGLNVVLINDALTAYTPVLDFSMMIGDTSVSMIEAEGEANFRGSFSIRSSYYNPIADVWEPFIEPFNLESEILWSKHANIKTQYVFSVASDVLNVNCSEVMVQNLQDILKMWDSNASDCQEVISPFQIKNEIGYSILIQYKHSAEVSVIESGATIDHVVDYYCRDKKLGKSDSITVTIFPGDFQPPKLRIKTNKVQCCTYTSGTQILVVDTSLKDTRKTLTIRSPFVIENQTEFFVTVFFLKREKQEKKECPPSKSCPVPYDFINENMVFEMNGSRAREFIRLDEFWLQKKNFATEAVFSGFFVCVYCKISKTNTNKRTIYLKPPINIQNSLPNSIGLRIYEGKPSKFNEIEIKKNEKVSLYSYSSTSELSGSLSLENFSRSNLFPLLSHQHTTSRIKVADRKNQELFVSLAKFVKGSSLIVFYVTQVLVNNSLNPVAFYKREKGSEILIPGQNFQNNIIPSNTTKKILIGLGNQKSKSFKIDSVGIHDIIELVGDTNPAGLCAKYQYTLDVQLVKILKKEMILSKVIVISPRYLIVNNAEIDVILAQEGLLECGITLQAGAQMPLHWTDQGHRELLRLKAKGENWAWSGPFSIGFLGNFCVQSKDNCHLSSFLLIKVDIKIIATTAHVILTKESQKSAAYRIQNDSRMFSLAIYQDGHAEDTRFIDSCSSCLFAWSNLLIAHEVIVEFILGPKATEGKDTKSMYKINLDKLNQSLRINIKEAPQDFDVLYVAVLNDGVSRVLKFSDMPFRSKSDLPDSILSYLNFSVPKVGVSLIEHTKYHTQEIVYLTAHGIIVLAQNTEKEWKAEFMVKNIQVDNQMSPDAIYPVMLHPFGEINRNVLHISMIVNNNSTVNCRNYESFEFLLQTLCLKLDTACVRKLIDLTNRIWLSGDSMSDLFETLEEFKEPYIKSETNSSGKTYYFSYLKIHPIKVVVFFVPVKEETTKKDLLSGIASFGMALTTLEAAPIKLYSIELSDVFATEKHLKESLHSHYKSQLMNEFYSLIGHSNILGNPIGLLNDLGTGVVDFFYEPAQGMINGPLSAGSGILKGTGSLIKNTVSGTFGTVSKFTSSITTGLAVLTQDKDYIMERQRDLAKNKPSNVVDGVGLGMLSFIKNIGQGITGVVTEPIKGFKKDKMGGMMKGGLRGLSGLVVKPIAGALDMVSRSAEGIKNTTNIFEHNLEYRKDRLPRVMYGNLRLVQNYNAHDAAVVDYLFRIGKKKYYEKEFIELIQGEDKDSRNVILIFFTDVLIYLNVTREKIMWKAFYKNISAFEVIKNVLCIKHKGKKGKEVIVKAEFNSQNCNLQADKKLKVLMTNLIN